MDDNVRKPAASSAADNFPSPPLTLIGPPDADILLNVSRSPAVASLPQQGQVDDDDSDHHDASDAGMNAADATGSTVHLDDDGNKAIDQKYPKRFGTKAQRLAGKYKKTFERWMEMYENLKAFKEQHGHMNPPKSKSSGCAQLYNWINNQRYEYQQFMNATKATPAAAVNPATATAAVAGNKEQPPPSQQLPVFYRFDEKIDLLKQIGFDFQKTREAEWMAMYKRLVGFKRLNGHLTVPRQGDDADLCQWLSSQRNELGKWRELMQTPEGRKKVPKRKDESRPSKAERIKKLEKLDIIWKLNDHAWETNYQKLRKYKEKNGDCMVPEKYKAEDGTMLGGWVGKQRENVRFLLQGKQSGMTAQRMAKLVDLGFHFRPSRIPVRYSCSCQTDQSYLSGAGHQDCGTQMEDSRKSTRSESLAKLAGIEIKRKAKPQAQHSKKRKSANATSTNTESPSKKQKASGLPTKANKEAKKKKASKKKKKAQTAAQTGAQTAPGSSAIAHSLPTGQPRGQTVDTATMSSHERARRYALGLGEFVATTQQVAKRTKIIKRPTTDR